MKLTVIFTTFIALICSNKVASQEVTPVCNDVVAPTISTQKPVTCSGQAVVLTATGCESTVIWSNQKSGASITVFPTNTTTYTAFCKKENCKSIDSKSLTIEVIVPKVPILNTSQKVICLGQSATLTATGCLDEIVWSNGMKGNEIMVSPILTTRYTATCRSNNCYSCFANEVEIRVQGNEVLKLVASKSVICAGEVVTISAIGQIDGQVKWNDGTFGKEITVKPTSNITYSASVESSNGCKSANSTDISIQVAPPLAPRVLASKNKLCYTETATLTAESCDGMVVWSNGQTGSSIQITNNQFLEEKVLNFTAVCKRGSCESVVSEAVILNLIKKIKTPDVVSLNNQCPFVSVDLSSGLKSGLSYSASKFVFHTADRSDSPIVANIGAVTTSGVYYVEEMSSVGCNSVLMPIIVKISDCQNPVPTCLNNPATASILKTEQTPSGDYLLQGKVGGSAMSGVWTTNGTGIFSNVSGLSTVYSPSEEDRKAGKISVNLRTEDPDGSGPCLSGSSIVEVKIEVLPSDQIKNKDSVATPKTEPVTTALNSLPSEEDIFIPEGFSPNEDGINDAFVIQQRNVRKVSVEIYNRWGGVVYKNEDYKNDWKGISNQKVSSKDRLPDGSYFYSIRLEDGREFSRFLTISR